MITKLMINCKKHGKQLAVPTWGGYIGCEKCLAEEKLKSHLKCQICGAPYKKLNKEKNYGKYEPTCKHNKDMRLSVG